MTELADLIRTELGVEEDSFFLSHESMRAAIGAVLDIHKADPDFEPPAGTCRSCGGTGEVYGGTGPDGHIWTGEKCCCDHPHCVWCGGCWESGGCPAYLHISRVIAEQLGLIAELAK